MLLLNLIYKNSKLIVIDHNLGEILLNSSLNQLLFQPTAVKKMVVDAAKQCPYYFGRFYAIEVVQNNISTDFYWVTIFSPWNSQLTHQRIPAFTTGAW